MFQLSPSLWLQIMWPDAIATTFKEDMKPALLSENHSLLHWTEVK